MNNSTPWRQNPALTALPIYPHLDDICQQLKSSPSRFLVLTAQTAAGKSTAVPLALLQAFSGKILMLEPRRLAALAIASRVAELLGEAVGESAGYRLHLEKCIGKNTRLQVMTEAILTRMLQSDPSLEGVSVVVLDEFHERSVHSDLALAFLKEAMSLREDLYVIVMSATMQTAAVSAYLDGAPVMEIPGRLYPVHIGYQPNWSPAKAVLQCLASPPAEKGNILVFLPGIGDIRRTAAELETALGKRLGAEGDLEVLLLHSSIPLAQQRKVLAPANPAAGSGEKARRRIILSSAIAETSLTVPDVTIVIDSGYSRINRMNLALGMEKLVTERESLFSANQRSGRAGRVTEGYCIRLWNQFDPLLQETEPEIQRVDLLSLVLECAAWGVLQAEKLDWLSKPSPAAWKSAQDLLTRLGCLARNEKNAADLHITPRGKAALQLGLHPRLAACLLSGAEKGYLQQALGCVLKFTQYADASPRLQESFCRDLERRLERSGVISKNGTGKGMTDGQLLLEGFPDRIGRKSQEESRDFAEYQFPSGRKARLFGEKNPPAYIVAPEADAGSTTARIYRFEPLPEAAALAWLEARAESRTQTVFADAAAGAKSGKGARLIKTVSTAYGALVLREKTLPASAEDYSAAVCAAIEKQGLDWLPLSPESKSLLVRAQFFADHAAAASSQAAATGQADGLAEKLQTLSQTAQDWLLPFLSGDSRLTEKTVYDGLYWYLGGGEIDRQVPRQIVLSNGKKMRISYEDSGNGIQPVLEVIIQQIFGCRESPKVLGVPVLLKLLSPARRPLQITDDLAGFWQGSWLEICKEMKGRYPKHNWNWTENS